MDSTGLEHRLVALLRVRIYKKMMIKFIFQIRNGKKIWAWFRDGKRWWHELCEKTTAVNKKRTGRGLTVQL